MSKGTFRKLVCNIKQTGLYEPIVVRAVGDEGKFEIINGHHRVRALRELGYEKADAVVWDVDDEQVGVLLLTLNRLAGKDDLAKKRALLSRLNRRMGAKELSRLVADSKAQIEKLVNMKLAKQPMADGGGGFREAMVFFVDSEQKRIVEAGLDAVEETEGNIAQRRAKALSRIASEFLRKRSRDGKIS